MPTRGALHPKAYLVSKRNVKAGLIARSKILVALEKDPVSAPQIAKEAGLSYACVAYHLKALKKDRLVERVSNRKPFAWTLTRFGQQKLPSV
ncbi:MAG TPA: winged helix-turn-helix domain-containing protein [Candidatus Dormibacteraeota bacterium]|nr:winged helix-turn-helix domain-containing protein [Candidatus Dormibacteraeota bacterium]